MVAMLASASAMAQSKDDVRDTVATDTTVWKSLELEGVVVKSHAVKVKVQGDSLVYNAAAYRVPEGSTLEALVKHKPETAIGASDIRALLGVLRAGDIALFVTSGTFSPDAKATGTSSREFIRLIDGDEFIDMWLEFYDKMTDDDKNMLPLKRIAFLGNNE